MFTIQELDDMAYQLTDDVEYPHYLPRLIAAHKKALEENALLRRALDMMTKALETEHTNG